MMPAEYNSLLRFFSGPDHFELGVAAVTFPYSYHSFRFVPGEEPVVTKEQGSGNWVPIEVGAVPSEVMSEAVCALNSLHSALIDALVWARHHNPRIELERVGEGCVTVVKEDAS